MLNNSTRNISSSHDTRYPHKFIKWTFNIRQSELRADRYYFLIIQQHQRHTKNYPLDRTEQLRTQWSRKIKFRSRRHFICQVDIQPFFVPSADKFEAQLNIKLSCVFFYVDKIYWLTISICSLSFLLGLLWKDQKLVIFEIRWATIFLTNEIHILRESQTAYRRWNPREFRDLLKTLTFLSQIEKSTEIDPFWLCWLNRNWWFCYIKILFESRLKYQFTFMSITKLIFPLLIVIAILEFWEFLSWQSSRKSCLVQLFYK